MNDTIPPGLTNCALVEIHNERRRLQSGVVMRDDPARFDAMGVGFREEMEKHVAEVQATHRFTRYAMHPNGSEDFRKFGPDVNPGETCSCGERIALPRFHHSGLQECACGLRYSFSGRFINLEGRAAA